MYVIHNAGFKLEEKMNFTAKEIINGKNLEVNLPKLGIGLMGAFNSYSFVRLAMNYYTYYEMISESYANDNILKNLIVRFNNTIKCGVLPSDRSNENIELLSEVTALRDEITDIMKGLTSLADIFNIYEYVLNRIEYNFKDGGHILIETDENFANYVMSYILSQKDNVAINMKICETVRELPVRMTKSRFFELLHTGLLVYKDSEKQSMEDFIFMLKTSSMLEINSEAFKLSEDIESIYNEFKGTDFSTLTEDKYKDLSAKLKFAVSFIQDMVNKYMMFAEIVNDTYVIVLSNPCVKEFPREHNACIKIIETLYKRFTDKNPLEDDIEIENYFFELEGKQEKYYRNFSTVLNAVEIAGDSYKDIIVSLKLDKMYNSLNIIRQLVSGSIFVEFDNVINTDKADLEYIDDKFMSLKKEYEEFFKSNVKLVNRAVMAHVLSALPIFFNNADEIKDYIKQSISQCSDNAEKLACYEIFHSLMEE